MARSHLEIPVRDDAAEGTGVSRGDWLLRALAEIDVRVTDLDVVDLGAGYGSISIAAAVAGARSVTAVDVHSDRLEAIERRSQAAGVLVRTRRLNLLEGWSQAAEADLVFLIGVVEYAGLWDLDAPVSQLQTQVFTTAFDALRPGGRLVFASKNRLWPRFVFRDANTSQPLVNVLPRAAADRVSRRLDGRPYRHHVHSARGWQDLVRSAGFAEARVYTPYLSYQFPLKLADRPSVAAQRAVSRLDLSPEARRLSWGRTGAAKAMITTVCGMANLSVAHGVFVVATKGG